MVETNNTETNQRPSGSPLGAYQARLDAGELKPDPAQAAAAQKLEFLHSELQDFEPVVANKGWGGALLSRLGLGGRSEKAPKGVYIHGDVGRGKSMLMDLFFDCAPIVRKRRVHFHEFMLEIHDRLHALRSSGQRVDDLLPTVAHEIAADAWLLCFDEFHVTNIADAMILGRLFEALFDDGVIIVATSNWPPDRLYEGGLQRELFLPFISLFKETLQLHHLEADRDYRLERLMQMAVYYTPLGPAATRSLDKAFSTLTDGATGQPTSIIVKKREVPVPSAANGVARFSFADLCGKPLGAADYIAIAQAYRTIILSDIPILKPAQKNEAKRFSTLIDALYEHKATLVASAEGPPQNIYREGKHAFEFQRTVSRLMEMQSKEYLEERQQAAA